MLELTTWDAVVRAERSPDWLQVSQFVRGNLPDLHGACSNLNGTAEGPPMSSGRTSRLSWSHLEWGCVGQRSVGHWRIDGCTETSCGVVDFRGEFLQDIESGMLIQFDLVVVPE
jgi:hypothetical protein